MPYSEGPSRGNDSSGQKWMAQNDVISADVRMQPLVLVDVQKEGSSF